jgi:hypothetical protein
LLVMSIGVLVMVAFDPAIWAMHGLVCMPAL